MWCINTKGEKIKLKKWYYTYWAQWKNVRNIKKYVNGYFVETISLLGYIFEQNSLKVNYLHACVSPTKFVVLC